MKRSLTYLLLLFKLAIAAQPNVNIVPDGGFEYYDAQCTFGPYSSIDSIVYWQNGNEASADYFGTCYSQTNGWVHYYPQTPIGYQYPRSGEAFAGIFVTAIPSQNYNLREYLQTELLIPLEAGKRYYAGFYVNLAEVVGQYSVNNLGMLLSDSIPAYDSNYVDGYWYPHGPIPKTPQVISDTTFNLNDTLGWMLVADTFIAQGGERWLTIGNFRDDAHSIIVPTGYITTMSDSGSYYFVDDVFLYCVDTNCATVPVGIKPLKETKPIKHYPNPTTGSFTIDYPEILSNESSMLQILSSDGRLLKTITLAPGSSSTTVDAELANGIYILKLERNGAMMYKGKLAVTR